MIILQKFDRMQPFGSDYAELFVVAVSIVIFSLCILQHILPYTHAAVFLLRYAQL